jgi:hypothetical protein
MPHRIPFSERPGRHERHFRRKLNNPLFPRLIRDYSDEELLAAQRADHEELMRFISDLKRLVVRAAQLPPNVETQVILELKEQLDQAYATSAGLAEDQGDNQTAITRLTEVIMGVIARGAAGDPRAQAELSQERQARAAHCQLLRQPIVADLLHPKGLISVDELVPCLLCEDAAGLESALTLFDAVQLGEIVAQARHLAGAAPDPETQARLRQIELHQWLENLEIRK